MARGPFYTLLLAVVALIGLGTWLTLADKSDQPVKLVASTGKALIGGPFTLVDQTGATVTDQSYRGKYLLIYFGYTFCPDVCPTELGLMSQALDALGDKAKQIQPLFITIDPERDTPQVLADYLANFRPGFVGLTGSTEQIRAVAKAYRVYYAKAPAGPGDEAPTEGSKDYLMNHLSLIFLMGPDGAYLKHFPPTETADSMARKIADLM